MWLDVGVIDHGKFHVFMMWLFFQQWMNTGCLIIKLSISNSKIVPEGNVLSCTLFCHVIIHDEEKGCLVVRLFKCCRNMDQGKYYLTTFSLLLFMMAAYRLKAILWLFLPDVCSARWVMKKECLLSLILLCTLSMRDG